MEALTVIFHQTVAYKRSDIPYGAVKHFGFVYWNCFFDFLTSLSNNRVAISTGGRTSGELVILLQAFLRGETPQVAEEKVRIVQD